MFSSILILEKIFSYFRFSWHFRSFGTSETLTILELNSIAKSWKKNFALIMISFPSISVIYAEMTAKTPVEQELLPLEGFRIVCL